jgi:hypothetical protein
MSFHECRNENFSSLSFTKKRGRKSAGAAQYSSPTRDKFLSLQCGKSMMKRITLLLLTCGSLLAGCASNTTSPYASYGEQRGVVGDFCPPSQAIKGNC